MLSLSAFRNSDRDAENTHITFMQNRSGEEWVTLLAQTQTIRFREGDTMLRLGEVDRTLYIVLSGQLEVLVPRSRGGGEQKVSPIEAGSVFGEQAFLDGQPRSATIRAVTDGEMRALHWASFQQLSAADPLLAQSILLDIGCILSERLRRMNQLFV